jgi:hypothetical protein
MADSHQEDIIRLQFNCRTWTITQHDDGEERFPCCVRALPTRASASSVAFKSGSPFFTTFTAKGTGTVLGEDADEPGKQQ